MLKTFLATLALSAAALYATGTTRPAPPDSFGLVGCLIEPDRPGPSFRMTINDQSDGMLVRTSLSAMSLPRDYELSDDSVHVAVLTDGERTIAVTLDQELTATVTTINDAVSTGTGQCERL